jgi:hypothetical protein
VTAVLRSLYWISVFFRLAADPQDPYTTEGPAFVGEGPDEAGNFKAPDFTPELRPYLRHVSAITVHTRKEGKGTRTRHVFENGEMLLCGVGDVPGKVNSHLKD